MSRLENPPFERGQTFYNGGTIDSNNLGGRNHEGKDWLFEDINWSTSTAGIRQHRSNRYVLCRCVRNTGAAALLPKRLVTYDGSALVFGARVAGYSRTTAQFAHGVVDEWLPAAGVPVNDLFWLTIAGPTLCLTALEADANNLIPVATVLVALTAVTSGATTAGRVRPQDLTGATALLGDQVQNAIGRALSAMTTANTGADVLIEMKRYF